MLVLIKVPCACGQQIQVTQTHAGQALRCPVCGQGVAIPRMGLPDCPTPPAALEMLSAPLVLESVPLPPAPSPVGPGSARPWLMAVGVLLALGVLVGSSAVYFNSREHPAPEVEIPAVFAEPTSPCDTPKKPRYQPLERLLEAHIVDLQLTLDQARLAIKADDLDEATRAVQTASQLAPENTELLQVMKDLEAARDDRKTRDTLKQLQTEHVQTEARARDIADQLAKLRAEKAQRDREAEAVGKQLEMLRSKLPPDILKSAREKAQKMDTQASFYKVYEAGQASLKAGKYEAAIADLTLAVTLQPNSREANALLKQAKDGQARLRQQVQQALAKIRDLLAAGQLTEARALLQEVIPLAPEDPEVLRHKYLVQNREEVQPLIDQTVKKGYDLAEDGRFDEAGLAFAKAVRLVPEVPAYRNLMEIVRQAARQQREAKLARERNEDVARARAATHDPMLALREHTSRVIAELKQQLATLQVHSDRMASASRTQMATIQTQTERMTFASGLQLLGIHEQTDRMTAASRTQLAGIQVQTDRMTAAGNAQTANLQTQTDRMTAASGAQFRVLNEQTTRMTGAAKLQMEGLVVQTDRMAAAGNAQMAAIQTQTDRMTVAAGAQMAGIQQQTDRMTAAGNAQTAAIQTQTDRVTAASRIQMDGLYQQTDRMTAAANAQTGALQTQTDRMARVNALQVAGLNEQTDRMTAAGNSQVALIQTQTDRMTAAASQPIAPFRARTELPRTQPDSSAPADHSAAEAEHEERQRKLREAAELKRLQAAKDQRGRDEVELKKLLQDKETQDRNTAELRQLLLEKERLDLLRGTVTDK